MQFCLVAGISIFFGYDQGVMGDVNTTPDYAELMAFGHWDNQKGVVVVVKPLLQGGIVSTFNGLAWISPRRTNASPGRRLLPPWNLVWMLTGRLVRR